MPDRICYMIDQTMCNAEGKWVPAIVTENQAGYSPTNWAWRCTYEQAASMVKDMNADMGLTEQDAWKIVGSSMGASNELNIVKHTRLEKLPLHVNSKSTEVQETLRKRFKSPNVSL